ncbi:MAG: hypothetical protein ACRDT1_00285 [Micromonosporaceae bacterium]
MDDFRKLVRSLVREDFKRFDKRVRDLEKRQDDEGCGEFLGSCFFLAAVRRFDPDDAVVDIIRFVANTRIVYDLTGRDIDPTAAERLIRTALGEHDPLEDLDAHKVRKLEIVLVHKLLIDEDLDDEGLDDLLHDAELLAQRWRAQSAVEVLQGMGYTVKAPISTATRQDRLAS